LKAKIPLWCGVSIVMAGMTSIAAEKPGEHEAQLNHFLLPGVLDATDDQGKAVWSPFPAAWANHFSLDLPYERETKTLNLKLALHKSRFVEFTVKPAKP